MVAYFVLDFKTCITFLKLKQIKLIFYNSNQTDLFSETQTNQINLVFGAETWTNDMCKNNR